MRGDRKQCPYKGAWSGQQGRSNAHQKGACSGGQSGSQVPHGEHHNTDFLHVGKIMITTIYKATKYHVVDHFIFKKF